MRERIGFEAKGVVCLPSHSGALQRVSRSASLHESAANAEDVALGSKNLLEAERAFCDLKTSLELWPMFYRLERRIRAHVLLRWLALLLIRVVVGVHRPGHQPAVRGSRPGGLLGPVLCGAAGPGQRGGQPAAPDPSGRGHADQPAGRGGHHPHGRRRLAA